MNDREPPGYDDWFDEPEPPTLESGRGGRSSYDIPAETEEDVWVLPEDRPRRDRRNVVGGEIVVFGVALTKNQLAIIAVASLAVIVALIAAFNGFGGNSSANPPTISNPTTLSTDTSTTVFKPTVTPPTVTLKEGDTGAQVKRLQLTLTAVGFSPGKADGSFGPATKTEVEDFQNAHGLGADGVVGKQTLAALRTALGG